MSVKLPGLRQSTANVLAIWLLQASTLLFALVSVPLITRRFGLEGLGVWLLVQQVASHVQLLELGLASSLGRFLSRDKATSNAEAFTAHSSSAIAVLVAMGITIILLAVPLGMVFPRTFDLPRQLESDAVAMLAIATVATGLILPLRSALGVLSSQHRFVLIYGADGLVLLLRMVLVIVACTQVEEHALVMLALAVFGPGLVGALVTFAASIRSTPYALFKFRAISIKPIRELLAVSFASMLVTLAAVLLRQGSPMLVGYSIGIDALPLIALPIMLVASVGPFLAIGNQLISPVASQLDASSRVNELRSIYVTAARYTLAVGLLMFAGMALVVPYLLPLWLGKNALGPNHAHLIYMNLLLVFGGYCLATPAFLARSVLISVGKHKVAATGEIISAIVGLSVGWMLMEALNFGAIGMAYGIGTTYIIRGFGILMKQLAMYFTVRLHQLFFEIWYLPLLATLPLGSIFIPGIMGYQSLIAIALHGFVGLLLWAWLVFRLIMPIPHRESLACNFRRVLKDMANL
jgi:O-antigen/teichoic acid export membrane protein